MNQWIRQTRPNSHAYRLVLSTQKNGGLKVIVCDDDRFQPAIVSTKNWFPAPCRVDESEVPQKILMKIEKHKNRQS